MPVGWMGKKGMILEFFYNTEQCCHAIWTNNCAEYKIAPLSRWYCIR
jgi:hypothetical protein